MLLCFFETFVFPPCTLNEKRWKLIQFTIKMRILTPSGAHLELHIDASDFYFNFKPHSHEKARPRDNNTVMKIYLYLDAKTHNLKQYCSRDKEY